jgi:hypothetical protein
MKLYYINQIISRRAEKTAKNYTTSTSKNILTSQRNKWDFFLENFYIEKSIFTFPRSWLYKF